MSKKRSSKSTKGRVCGVCIAGLVSGMASGGVLARKRAKAQQGRSGGTLQPIGWWYSDERVAPPKWLPAKTREEAIQKGHEKNPGAGFYILPRMPNADDFEEVERRHATGEEPFPEYIEARGRSGGAKPDLVYRAVFDRPKHLSATGYGELVKLEAGTMTHKQLKETFARWKVGAKLYDAKTRALLMYASLGPHGEWQVFDLSEKGRSAGRTRKGRSSGQEVANGILEQLGGRKFLVMTSAKHLLSFHEPGHGGLQFKLPRSGARAKLGIDAVRITLELSDTYTMDFYKGMTKVRSIGSLYSDDLRKTFTEVTGLETSLGTMGRAAGKKDPKEIVSWGVFPWTPDLDPAHGDPVPDAKHHGYVAREVNRETGRGTHWPYSRVQAVKIYWRRHLADAYATELTYGRKK